MLESCQDLNKIKQLDIRLTTLSGFFQMMFTAGFSYFKQEAVYESVQGLKNLQSTDCTTVGKLYGQFLAAILQTKTVSQLNQAEVSTFGSGNGGASTIQTSDSSTTPTTPWSWRAFKFNTHRKMIKMETFCINSSFFLNYDKALEFNNLLIIKFNSIYISL